MTRSNIDIDMFWIENVHAFSYSFKSTCRIFFWRWKKRLSEKKFSAFVVYLRGISIEFGRKPAELYSFGIAKRCTHWLL